MISKYYLYYLSLWLYASNIAICSQELHNFDQQMEDQSRLLNNFDQINDFEFDIDKFNFDDDFLQENTNAIHTKNNLHKRSTYNFTQQQIKKALHHPSVLALTPEIIAKKTQDFRQQNSKFLSDQESKQDKEEQIKVCNQIGDKKLATKTYKAKDYKTQKSKVGYKTKQTQIHKNKHNKKLKKSVNVNDNIIQFSQEEQKICDDVYKEVFEATESLTHALQAYEEMKNYFENLHDNHASLTED